MIGMIALCSALGVAAGIFTGLTPGVHVNLVSLLLLESSGLLLGYIDPLSLSCFIISMCITHTFLDAVPSIFLGAPDTNQVLNVLPGHKLLLEGKGYTAVLLSTAGAYLCLLFTVILIPLLVPLSKIADPILKNYMGWLLLGITAFMIFKDEKWLWNLALFILSGTLGLAVLNIARLDDPLFPLLSGLFGIPTLICSISEKVHIPVQVFEKEIPVDKGVAAQSIIAGSFAGTLTGFFPGVGPAQGAVLASQFVRKIGDYGFMMLVGGIGTVNFVFSLITLITIDKARNGAVIVVQKLLPVLNMEVLLIFIAVTLIVGGIGAFLALRTAKIFAKMISKVNYPLLAACVLVFVTSLVIFLTGWLGLLVMIVATAVGLIPQYSGTARNHQMGCLILPVMLFFLL